jgi:hypothetical protein
MLQARLAVALGALADSLHLIDGLPMPVCKFARAYFNQVFKGSTTYGYCVTKKERYYGFRGHLVVSSKCYLGRVYRDALRKAKAMFRTYVRNLPLFNGGCHFVSRS